MYNFWPASRWVGRGGLVLRYKLHNVEISAHNALVWVMPWKFGCKTKSQGRPRSHRLIVFNWINKDGNFGNLDQIMGYSTWDVYSHDPKFISVAFMMGLEHKLSIAWNKNTASSFKATLRSIHRASRYFLACNAFIYQLFGIGLWILTNHH